MKQVLLIFTLLFVYSPTWGKELIKHPRLISFEAGVPAEFKAQDSSLSQSTSYYKDGAHSLQWSFNPSSSLVIERDLAYEEDKRGASHISTFSTWIYNPNPIDDTLRFEFYKDSLKCSWFEYNLNFKGWRLIYVAYQRDMQGSPELGMNKLKVIAPKEKGDVFFDMILTSSKVDKRHHTPDIHQPFVNKGVSNHWQVMLEKSNIEPDKDLLRPLTTEDKQYAKLMDTRLRELIVKPTSVNAKKIDKLKKELSKYNIHREGDILKGVPLFYVYYAEAFEKLLPKWQRNLFAKRGQEYKDYFNLMYKIANNHANTTNQEHRKQLEELFLLMIDYAQDQGVAYGSGLGNASHYGYSFRGFFTACFLMKDVLMQTGRLSHIYQALQWYAQTNEVFIRPTVNGQDMDAFNTLAMAKICSILIMDDTPEKFQYIRAYSRWVDTGCKPSPGLTGSFKVDGGAFHHVNHYPAYAVGGLEGATNMIYIFHQTPFAISEEGHATVRNVLLAMRFYCNQNHFPLALSGRHPDGKGKLAPMQFARMALSGTADGTKAIDQEMAAAFLRLTKQPKSTEHPEYVPSSSNQEIAKTSSFFKRKGIKAEPHPQGNKAIAYASIAAHRRDNWLALAKGFSRYFWASEHYARENFYGRYLSYGTLQILTAKEGEVVTPKTSGWIEEGFNWARIPGATALNLPIDKMRAAKNRSEMLLSDESFAGGVTINNQNGAYGIKLHEHDRYEGSHRARKSYHFFDNRIISLGSNIENTNEEYNTETTVFQLAVQSQEEKIFWEQQNSNRQVWTDPMGTSYYIAKTSLPKIRFEKNYPQVSKSNKGKPTQADWVSLIIDHAKAPQNEAYEYVVMPKTDFKAAKKVKKTYEVLQQNREAHIVKDLLSHTTSYVLFEAGELSYKSVLKHVDTPSLVMIQQHKKNLTVALSNPDLAFYTGPSKEIYDKQGKRMMVNPYATSWKDNESKKTQVVLTLQGLWKMTGLSDTVSIKQAEGKTYISWICQHGLTQQIELKQDSE